MLQTAVMSDNDRDVSDPVMDVGPDNGQQGEMRSSLRRSSAQNDNELDEDENQPM